MKFATTTTYEIPKTNPVSDDVPEGHVTVGYSSIGHSAWGLLVLLLISLMVWSVVEFSRSWLNGDLCTNQTGLILSGIGYSIYLYVIIGLVIHVSRRPSY